MGGVEQALSQRIVREIVGAWTTDDEAAALAEWYANLSRGVAAYPEADLKGVEPPLRSTPGPVRQ
jgi:hypothetical protein